jgi:hypothetical protein
LAMLGAAGLALVAAGIGAKSEGRASNG